MPHNTRQARPRMAIVRSIFERWDGGAWPGSAKRSRTATGEWMGKLLHIFAPEMSKDLRFWRAKLTPLL